MKRLARAIAAAFNETVGNDDRIHGPGASPADRLDADPAVLQEAVEDAPGKSAVGTAALQGEVDHLRRFLAAAFGVH